MSRRPPCLLLAEETWGGGLHAIRSLGRLGAPALVAVAGRGADVYGASRDCFAARDFPLDPGAQPDAEAWSARVVEWVERTVPSKVFGGPIPVLPLSDRLVEVLHRSRPVFGPRFRPAVPEGSVTERLLDKARAFEAAEAIGLDVPSWIAVTSSEDVARTGSLDLPVVVRPRRWSSAGSAYFKLKSYDGREQLFKGLSELVSDGADVVAQERVPGPDESVEWAVFYRGGAGGPWAVCTGRKRRQASPEGGVMVWGEAVPMPELEAMARQFTEANGFRGLGGLEVKRRDGRLWFIEVNPRLEAIHFLAARAGVDTVAIAYRHLALGERVEAPPPQRPAAAWVGGAWLARLSATGDWRTAVRDAAAFAASPDRVMAVWSPRDPLPWLKVSGRVARAALRRLLEGARGKRS